MGSEKKQSFQKYAQLPYKPFAYQEGTGTLNFRILANVEPEQLFSSGDLETAQTVLRNFSGSQLPENMEFEVFSKLLRFSQLGIAHFAAQQTQQQQALDENYLKFKSLQDQDAHLEELKTLHAEKKPQYEEELKSLSVRVKELKKKSQSMGSYRCVYCGKTYTEKDTLESHTKRRHIDQLNEIYDTQEMLQKNADPVAGLKKKQFDEIKKQNDIELEKIDKVQKALKQQNINEDKLIQEISSKLKEDFFAKLKVLQSQLQDSQLEVSAVEDSSLHQSVDRSKGNNNPNNNSNSNNQDEEQTGNPPGFFERNKARQFSSKNPKLEEQIQKMASNFESVNQALQKIKESQDLMDQQSKEYQQQLKRIVDGQEELRKSGVVLRLQAPKEGEVGGFQGSIVSNASVPTLNSRKTSLADKFPIQGLPTADFSRNSLAGTNKFFEKPMHNSSIDQQEDSFMNNSNNNNNNEESRNISHQQASIALPLQFIASQHASPKHGMTNSFMRPKVFHIGELEEDYNSEDEKRKAYQEQKELKAKKNHQQQSSQGRLSSEKTHSKNPSLMMFMQEGSFKKKPSLAGGIQKSENYIMPHSEVYSDSNSRRESKQTVQSDEEEGDVAKKTTGQTGGIIGNPSAHFANAGSTKNIKPDETTKKKIVLRNQMSFGQKGDSEKHDELGRKSGFGGKVQTDESINNMTGESPIKLEDMAGKLSSRDKLSRQSSQNNNNNNGSRDMIRQNSNSDIKDNANSKQENDRNLPNNNNNQIKSGILDSQQIGLPPPPPLANKLSANHSSRNIGAAASGNNNNNLGNQQSESIFDRNSKSQKISLIKGKVDTPTDKPSDSIKRKQPQPFMNPGNNEIDEIRRDLIGDISKDSNLNTSRSENVSENPAKKRMEDILKNDGDNEFFEEEAINLEGGQKKKQQTKQINDKDHNEEEEEDF